MTSRYYMHLIEDFNRSISGIESPLVAYSVFTDFARLFRQCLSLDDDVDLETYQRVSIELNYIRDNLDSNLELEGLDEYVIDEEFEVETGE